MCLATPMKILEIKKDNKAVVGSAKHTHEVDLSLIKEPKVGEYILAHGDLAINKIPLTEAKKILELINGKHT
ncbi:MAG: HypC/HybG/HupF family hydrogenase formation chaperone [Candidatus Parcubacteria bacterium]|nr:HypC/HybG/HupF family hydrogenase formation chaperone [Candidatus Parcubacteria bacterium]